jgi:acyl-CoA thioesterase-1
MRVLHLPTKTAPPRVLALRIALILLCVNAVPARGALGDPVRVAVLGDSLTAGYGLREEDAFPARLERALRDEGLAVTVENAGVSGDTSAGGRARLGWLLASQPDAVIVELGGNDALRGLDPGRLEENLGAILAELAARGVPALLAGMRAPPNLGPAYVRAFDAVFPRLAKRHGALFYPFFLEGVAGAPGLAQPDGIHPNARGVDEIVARILPRVRELVALARPR